VSASTVGLYSPNTVVRVVGRANMGESVLQTGDGPINIRKPPGATFLSSGIFEVVGPVNQDGSVTETSLYDWKEIDMEVYNNMLTVYQKYAKEIFL